MDQLRARVAAQTALDQQALTQAAVDQLTAMSAQMQARLDEHVVVWDKRVTDALNTTHRAIASDLDQIRWTVRKTSNMSWWWRIWPPIASAAISLLFLLVAGWIASGWVQGIPSTQINLEGQTTQVLTGPDWTTCPWQGQTHPCRPLDSTKE